MSDVEAPTEPTPSTGSSRIAPILGVLVGLPMLAYGIRGALIDSDRTKPFELARWVVGADLAHDLILAPVVVGVSWLIGRVVPPIARSPVRWAAATTGVLALISWAFVRGYGRNATVPSLLDRNYARGLAVYLAVVWAAAFVWLLFRLRARSVHQMRDSTTTAATDSTTA